jgi:hypothetical protein
MKRWLAMVCMALALLCAGCGQTLAPIPPVNTPSPITLATALPDGWAALQQVPLQIPTLGVGEPCPVVAGSQVNPTLGAALGSGPLYLVGLGKLGQLDLSQANRQNSDFSMPILLTTPPAYTTDMLVRGQPMDGPNALLFSLSSGSEVLGELQLSPDTAGTAAGADGDWLIWSAYLVVSGPGCYGLQIDGAGFSEVLVFQAVEAA